MLTLVLCAALAAELDAPRDPHPVTTPAFLPRYAYAGIYLNQYAVAPNLRLGWELTVYDDARNLLMLAFELGPGFGIAFPPFVTSLWEHTVIGGLGYRWGRDKGFVWGFTLGAGVVLEGGILQSAFGDAALPRRSRVPDANEAAGYHLREEWVYGWIEGRLYAGWDFGPIILGLAFGYASPLGITTTFPTTLYIGGFNLGIYVNWR